MVIAASETNSLEARQIELSSYLKTKQAENTRKLMDRLVIRLGFDSIVCLKPIARYFPELASQEIPAVLMPAGLKEEWKKLTHHPLRPLRLLARPLPVEVVVLTPGGLPVQFLWHRRRLKVAVAEGPERITAEWWKNDDNLKKNQPFVDRTRDYYRVEDEEGKRYWLYCEKINQPDSLLKWHIHGFFA